MQIACAQNAKRLHFRKKSRFLLKKVSICTLLRSFFPSSPCHARTTAGAAKAHFCLLSPSRYNGDAERQRHPRCSKRRIIKCCKAREFCTYIYTHPAKQKWRLRHREETRWQITALSYSEAHTHFMETRGEFRQLAHNILYFQS